MKRVEIEGFSDALLDGAGVELALFNRGHDRGREV
jgi:hypothetical protein